MSLFEKIIIPLIDDDLSYGDILPQSGFVDSYTADPDKPCGENAIYLTYNDSIRTDMTKRCASRLGDIKSVRYRYVKMVNKVPTMVYKLYVKPEVKHLFSGHIELTPEQMVRIFDFWGYNSDVAIYLCSNKQKVLNVEHNMPLEDYVPRFDNKKGGYLYR